MIKPTRRWGWREGLCFLCRKISWWVPAKLTRVCDQVSQILSSVRETLKWTRKAEWKEGERDRQAATHEMECGGGWSTGKAASSSRLILASYSHWFHHLHQFSFFLSTSPSYHIPLTLHILQHLYIFTILSISPIRPFVFIPFPILTSPLSVHHLVHIYPRDPHSCTFALSLSLFHHYVQNGLTIWRVHIKYLSALSLLNSSLLEGTTMYGTSISLRLFHEKKWDLTKSFTLHKLAETFHSFLEETSCKSQRIRKAIADEILREREEYISNARKTLFFQKERNHI